MFGNVNDKWLSEGFRATRERGLVRSVFHHGIREFIRRYSRGQFEARCRSAL